MIDPGSGYTLQVISPAIDVGDLFFLRRHRPGRRDDAAPTKVTAGDPFEFAVTIENTSGLGPSLSQRQHHNRSQQAVGLVGERDRDDDRIGRQRAGQFFQSDGGPGRLLLDFRNVSGVAGDDVQRVQVVAAAATRLVVATVPAASDSTAPVRGSGSR